MGLHNLVIPTETIKIPGNDDLVVRGLGADSIIFLVRHHSETLENLYGGVTEGTIDTDNPEALALALANQSPNLIAMIIACGVGEPEQWETAGKLPFSIQIDALIKIGRLSLSAEGGLEKMMGSVMQVMTDMSSLGTPET